MFVPRFPFLADRAYTVLVHPALCGGTPTTTTSTSPTTGASRSRRGGRPAAHDDACVAVHPASSDRAPQPAAVLRAVLGADERRRRRQVRARGRRGDRRSSSRVPCSPMDPELWDPARTRLTVLLDPARIKRGLAPHREAGYALARRRRGRDRGRPRVPRRRRPSAGRGRDSPLRASGPDVRRRVDPALARRRPRRRHAATARGPLRPPARPRPARPLPRGRRRARRHRPGTGGRRRRTPPSWSVTPGRRRGSRFATTSPCRRDARGRGRQLRDAGVRPRPHRRRPRTARGHARSRWRSIADVSEPTHHPGRAGRPRAHGHPAPSRAAQRVRLDHARGAARPLASRCATTPTCGAS